MQPKHNRPPIFWNPILCRLLVYGPFIGIIGLVISAFALTGHPWLFLLFTVIWWAYNGHKRKSSHQGYIMPVLTEDGVKLETISTEKLLEDIRAQKQETTRNNNQIREEN